MLQAHRWSWGVIAVLAVLSGATTTFLTLQTGMNLDGAHADDVAGLTDVLGIVFFGGVGAALAALVVAVAMLAVAERRENPWARAAVGVALLLSLAGPVGAIVAEVWRMTAMR